MKLRQSFSNLAQKVSKKAKFAFVAIIGISALSLGVAHAEFYPARPVFDYNKAPLNGTSCTVEDEADLNICGSMSGPVFNSFINTPSYGDERAFVDGRRSDMPANTNADLIKDVTEGSQEVVIRMYVHNNANQNTNGSGVGIAKDTNVRVALPTATENVLRARGYINASNAAQVEDTTDLAGSKDFSVSYVAGSAKALRGSNTYALNDSIVTTGAPIGDNIMNGELPGCFDYAVLVELTVKINVVETPKIDIDKQVRKHVSGQKGNWSEDVRVMPGDKVDFIINTKNIGDSDLTDVVTRDALPQHLQLVSESVTFYKGSTTQELQDGPLFAGGYNSGLYNPGNNTVIVFSAIALGDFDKCEVRVRNIALASSAQTTGEVDDSADVIITKENCDEVDPMYACTDLVFVRVRDNTYKFTASAIAENGATVKQYSYNFGDDTEEALTDNNMVEHTYAAPGTYVATVDVTFNVGEDMPTDADNPDCVVKVVVGDKTCPIPGKEHLPADSKDCAEVKADVSTPIVLPNTGAGSIAGLLAVVTVAGAAAHRAFVLKRQ